MITLCNLMNLCYAHIKKDIEVDTKLTLVNNVATSVIYGEVIATSSKKMIVAKPSTEVDKELLRIILLKMSLCQTSARETAILLIERLMKIINVDIFEFAEDFYE